MQAERGGTGEEESGWKDAPLEERWKDSGYGANEGGREGRGSVEACGELEVELLILL